MSDIPTSGNITLNQMHTEAGGTSGTACTLNDSDIRGLIGKSSGVSMFFNEWYGAAAEFQVNFTPGFWTIQLGGGANQVRGSGVSVFNNTQYGSFTSATSQGRFLGGILFLEVEGVQKPHGVGLLIKEEEQLAIFTLSTGRVIPIVR